MIYLYWFLAVPTGLLAAAVIFLTLGGQALSAATPAWLALVAAGVVLGLLGWGYKLATAAGKPGRASLLVVLAWVLFAGAMLVNGLMHQTVWN